VDAEARLNEVQAKYDEVVEERRLILREFNAARLANPTRTERINRRPFRGRICRHVCRDRRQRIRRRDKSESCYE
jgi:hypothetical protein